MTDNLRDRVAAVIRDHGTPVGIDTGEADEFDCCAQAIIDDLGLTVERVIRALPPEHLQDAPMDNPEVQEWVSHQPTSTRVVGRWES